MKRSDLTPSLRDALLLVFVVAMTLLLTALLGDAERTAGAIGILLTSTAIGALVGGFVTAAILSGRLNHVVSLRTSEMEKRIATLAGAHIVLNDHLQELESSIEVPEVWIVTSSPEFDSTGTGDSFWHIIDDNIRSRGIKYRYIVPDSLGESSQNALLKSLPPDSVEVHRLRESEWEQLPLSDSAIIVYNPNAEHGYHDCVAYFEYPARDDLCWGRVETRKAVQWADRIRKAMHDGDD